MQFLEKLNPQQREAVETVHGPVLILAGAGSGKTRVITYRIAYLIEKVGVSPDSILAMTFTNKAAAEMQERVEHLVGGRTLAKPVISTFHSFCVRVLRRDIEALQINGKGYRKDFAIYDESDQQSLVKSAMKRLGIDDKQLTVRNVLSRISHAKNHLLDPQEVYLQSGDPKVERIAQIYKVYESELAKANALDFDDLLLMTNKLLKTSTEVRERYNRRFQYVLIDEYQDTNRPQYEIMRALAGTLHNVCAVGDEDQSIYSWRGADIRNILEFEQDFPEAKIVRLEQNYRSTQNILEAASAVVKNNLKRKGKNLWTERMGGAKVGYYEAPDGENESLFVADYINKYLMIAHDEDDEPKRAAVLYRTNSQSRLFEEAMRRYGIKYNVVGGFSFYERAEIKDMISYLKLIQNPSDSVALLRTINTPTRGIGKTTVEQIERIALETNLPLWDALGHIVEQRLMQPRACAALKGFRELIQDARAMLYGKFEERLVETAQVSKPEESDAAEPEIADEDLQDNMAFDFGELEPDAEEFSPEALGTAEEAAPEKVEGFRSPGENANVSEVLKFLIDRTGYIKQLEAEDTPESLARIENLRELVNAAMDSRDRGETIADFLDHAALVADTDDIEAGAQVTLMTMHAAKGLEFPLVFIVGMEEGLFPSSRTLMNPDEVEEERRLCYVGMTRAMRILVLSRARYRRRYGTDMPDASTASRFLSEVPPQLFEDIGSPQKKTPVFGDDSYSTHYDYENEDQRPQYGRTKQKTSYGGGSTYNSIDNIAEFFASRGKKFNRPSVPMEEPHGKRGFRPGQKVKHPKYGEGTVYQREGEGEEAKITVQFPRFGLKKLVEKFAQLEKA
ncbi:ATP-dependent DNA helicase, Rep family [Candidatus Koribacter versatilis Ellin345]|uniref:DNA 3'-5' helicase n=1 Tax=Koribacter versatilis (strain Ellin345) TaxID=204669 RepID=Q1IVP8_KORVE|nr:UvrD-helicase domain-containing protein [Candidatus Koribacter versatilis]ABF39052.1 ATP-dependent DNA helicase, Rep family [Candidatus Koribacter versatilis Ellin345]